MPINWNTVEAKERLFLATVAACDPKVSEDHESESPWVRMMQSSPADVL